jgi:hypothetical protein
MVFGKWENVKKKISVFDYFLWFSGCFSVYIIQAWLCFGFCWCANYKIPETGRNLLMISFVPTFVYIHTLSEKEQNELLGHTKYDKNIMKWK